MAGRDEITIHITGHGRYTTTATRLDLMMAFYPTTLVALRVLLNDRARRDGTGIDYSDVETVTECLMILAAYEGYARS